MYELQHSTHRDLGSVVHPHTATSYSQQTGTLVYIILGNTQYSNMPSTHLVFILTYDREDNNASKHWCEAICEWHHDSIPVTVVVNRVIRWEGNKATKSKSQWEEDLCPCLQPHNRIRQCPPLKATVRDCTFSLWPELPTVCIMYLDILTMKTTAAPLWMYGTVFVRNNSVQTLVIKLHDEKLTCRHRQR